MAAPPYFKFYPSDWLESDTVQGMPLDIEGAYIRILSAMWRRGGKLANKPHVLRNILKSGPTKTRKIMAALEHEFGVIYLDGEHYFNNRMNKEMNIFSEKSKKNSENVSKRWANENKKEEKAAKKPNKINDSNDTNVLRTYYHTDSDTDLDSDIDLLKKDKKPLTGKPVDVDPDKLLNGERLECFAEFYAQYPKKVGRKAAETKFCSKVKTRSLFDQIMFALSRQLQTDKYKGPVQYIPAPAAWLNQERWLDDLNALQNEVNANGAYQPANQKLSTAERIAQYAAGGRAGDEPGETYDHNP